MLGKGLSVYLDMLRVVAALLVVLCHLGQAPIGGFDMFSGFVNWGHEAVIIFFVLSGFVIHQPRARPTRLLNASPAVG
jgi:peptidoglycan/LPS O-acetylase OafA/YrhL